MYGRLGMFEPGLLEIAFSEKTPQETIDAFLEEYKYERVAAQSSTSEPSPSNYYLHIIPGREAEIMAFIRSASGGIVSEICRVPMRNQRYGLDDLM
jgi:hypothetical protein